MKKVIIMGVVGAMAMVLCACGGSSSSYKSSGSSFTNDYGTSTTKCAHAGCNKYIAKSGDTNCCATHSNNCYSCGCYIDEDAMFCMDCLEDALK